MRQRSEQKGKSSLEARTTLRQVGQKRALGAESAMASVLMLTRLGRFALGAAYKLAK